MRISRSVMAVGGVVLAAGLIGFTNPKAVHAITAALVQVTNTASNPVVTQGTNLQASQIVYLECQNSSPYYPLACSLISMNAAGTNPVTTFPGVPAGQSLIINSVDIESFGSSCSSSPGQTEVSLIALADGNELVYQNWTVPLSTQSHFVYPSGLVFPQGYTFSLSASNNSPVCTTQMYLRGYLTAS